MKTKRGAMAIIFSRGRGGKAEFLLLHRALNWSGWEFVKGGIDAGETVEQAALREAREETGLEKLKIVKKLPGKNVWAAAGIKYDYDVFLVEADSSEEIKLQKGVVEHDEYGWCGYEKAVGLLTHENTKEALRKARAAIGG